MKKNTQGKTIEKPIANHGSDDMDMVSEVLARSREIRQQAPKVVAASEPDKWDRDKSPIYRMRLDLRDKLDTLRFHEKDSNGKRRTLLSLLDEAVELLLLSRSLDSDDKHSKMSFYERMEKLVEGANKKKSIMSLKSKRQS